MMSIWDVPNATVAPTFDVSPRSDVSGLPGGDRAMGVPGGQVLTARGYGVSGGVPRGLLLQTERSDRDDRWALDRAAGERLRAATDAALGR